MQWVLFDTKPVEFRGDDLYSCRLRMMWGALAMESHFMGASGRCYSVSRYQKREHFEERSAKAGSTPAELVETTATARSPEVDLFDLGWSNLLHFAEYLDSYFIPERYTPRSATYYDRSGRRVKIESERDP